MIKEIDLDGLLDLIVGLKDTIRDCQVDIFGEIRRIEDIIRRVNK